SSVTAITMRLRVTYHLACSSRLAAAKARDIAFEQTVELPADAVPPEVAARVAGHVESVQSLGRGRSRAVISFDPGAVCGDVPQLLNLLFGNISLKAGILIAGLEWPDELLTAMSGPPEMVERADVARRAGCHGVVVNALPAGLGAVGTIAAATGLAVMSHPSLAGAFFRPDHGIAPEVLLGDLFRLAGSDAVIYPNVGGRF